METPVFFIFLICAWAGYKLGRAAYRVYRWARSFSR